MNPRGLVLLVVASAPALWAGAEPVSATHSSDHATAQIGAVVTEGREAMSQVVSGLAGDIAAMSDETAVDAAGDQALDSVEDIWVTARTAVDELRALYPGQLGQVVADAKQQLQEARLTARNTMSDLLDAWTPPAPVITATTTTTTTPATVPAPAAGPGANPGHGPDSNPGNGPGDNPGNEPDNNSGSGPGTNSGKPDPGGEPDSHQAGPARPARQPPSASGSPVVVEVPSEVPGSGIVLELAALTPDQPFTVSPEAITGLLVSSETGTTATMAAMLDTVLSPAVVDLVLSPILILEILLRTLVDGGLRLIGPLTLFATSGTALFAYDRFAKRDLTLHGSGPGLPAGP